MMRKAIMALVSASVFFCASAAYADNYFTAKVGLYSPEEDFLDNGFNIEAAYGMDISDMTGIDNLALELGIGYYTASFDEAFTFFDPFFGTITAKSELDLTVIPITATGIYSFDLDLPVKLYAGAGLGFYWVKVEITESAMGFRISEDDSEFKFGFNLVGGARYELNDQMDLVAELKYASVSDDAGGVFVNVGVKYNF
jgi:opacity protein-like surface antigen